MLKENLILNKYFSAKLLKWNPLRWCPFFYIKLDGGKVIENIVSNVFFFIKSPNSKYSLLSILKFPKYRIWYFIVFVAITETELLCCTSLPHLLLNPCLKGKQTNIKFLLQTKPLSTRAVDVSVKPISRGSSSIDNIAWGRLLIWTFVGGLHLLLLHLLGYFDNTSLFVNICYTKNKIQIMK